MGGLRRHLLGQDAVELGAQTTMQLSDFGDQDALLAVATDRTRLRVPTCRRGTGWPSTSSRCGATRSSRQLRQGDWAGAAVAAANGLNTPTATSTGAGSAGSASSSCSRSSPSRCLLLWLWMRRRRRKRREAEFAAAQRVDPADPNALASVPIDALDDLSKAIVVDVDNAVRTSDNELALAVEEFGTAQTEPFSRAVANAKTTLAQAFNVRQILDDAVPETPQQRRDLLTRVVVAAAKADRELDAQREAFEQAARSGDQRPDPAGRADPADGRPHRADRRRRSRRWPRCTAQFAATALASVADNVETAKQRLAFADQNITNARALVARPAGQQMGLVDAIRAARVVARAGPHAAGRRRQRGAPTSTARSPRCRRRSPTSRTASTRPADSCSRATRRKPAELTAARDAAVDGGGRCAEDRQPPIRSARSPS